jgi:DNA polymerase-3 subunit gamma/tau
MVSRNLMICGTGDRTLEIRAAKKTLLVQNLQNSRHLEASRFLYLRAVRKLTSRFDYVLWEGEDKFAKFSPLLQEIDDSLEELEPGRTIPDDETLQKILDGVEKNCEKLESNFLYESLPVSQIRNFSAWAHLASENGKKVLVIENADMMMESARNALLKILEEPPQDVCFILTTSRRSSILPTILSRVRTYNFFERTAEQQQNVIRRVFHHESNFNDAEFSSVDEFLQSFLSVSPQIVLQKAAEFFDSVSEGKVPDAAKIVSDCGSFEPRLVFKIFIKGIISAQSHLKNSQEGAEISFKILQVLQKSLNSVTIFNQNPRSCLEELTRSLMQINFLNDGFLSRKKNEKRENFIEEK